MYRSGISSLSITTLEPSDSTRSSTGNKNTPQTHTRRQEAAQGFPETTAPVQWRTLALALTAESSAKRASGTESGQSSRPRPKTASSSLSGPFLSLSVKKEQSSALLDRDRENIAVAGSANCKPMKFSSEYYDALSRVVELQAPTLPLSSNQVVAGIKLIWAHAPDVNRCLYVALQLEAASSRTGLHALSRENCVEVIACCLKWMHYVGTTDDNAPTSAIRRAIIGVCDSIFIELQPAVWRTCQPVSTVPRMGLIDITYSCAAAPDATALQSARCLGDEQQLPGEFQATAISGGTYKFRKEVLVKNKLSADCIPAWLENCSDDHLLEAACSCPTFYEVCQQFAKQEQHSRQQCANAISEIHELEEKVAALCREEDAAVRHAYALDWDRSNLFRSVELAREDLEGRLAAFDACLDDMIRRQNELLKQVQEVLQLLRFI
jgi:hypothetical protein